jgi:cell division protein ZapA (FtsZ GTPase activity inhibitor)
MPQDLHETAVKIRGTTYQLRTDLPSEEVRELARYVDDTMKALDPKSALPPAKVSVLASMSIAGELFIQRKRVDAIQSSVEKRVARLAQMLEAALDPE